MIEGQFSLKSRLSADKREMCTIPKIMKPLGSYQRQSDKTSQILKLRQASGGRGDNNLNLINNNRNSQEEREEKQSKRRSYNPQDFLSKVNLRK